MKNEDAKDGMAVQGHGTYGFLSQQPNGWDVITVRPRTIQRFQSVDLSEWEPRDEKPPVRGLYSSDSVR
jgi:hypothetical protein